MGMNVEKLIPALIRAGFEKDIKTIESIALTILRMYKKQKPNISDEIAKILSFKNIGASSYRSVGMTPSPVDEASRFPLVKITEPLDIYEPIFEKDIYDKMYEFINEREKSEEFLKYGLNATNSLLLFGEPGVGKTYSAKWLSSKLELPLITLDLSTTISSYLGKTGQNIKQVLEHAKSFPSILFLDEFDAIAKRRDDSSDIGELKRIVNVLLKELEEWPQTNILIAATNHPEILDKAIWRRFHKHIELKNLKDESVDKLIIREMEILKEIDQEELILIKLLVMNKSPADIVKICEEIKRKYILLDKKKEVREIILLKLNFSKLSKKEIKELCFKLLKLNPKLSAKYLIDITMIAKSTAYRYIEEFKKK